MLDYELSEDNNNQIQFDLPRLYLDGKKIKLIELFGGIGSQAKALEILSKYSKKVIFEHYKLVEFDSYCVKSYNAIHNTNFEVKDITKITCEDLNIVKDDSIYILTYSFPCQDLSTAGKGRGMEKGSGTRSSLLWEVERLLLEQKDKQLPQILVMENVPQVRTGANKFNFDTWKRTLEALGYSNFVKVLNAKDYGIPQTRRRCFMVSILSKEHSYHFPNKIKLNITAKDIIKRFEEVDEKYRMSDTLLKCLLKEDTGGFDRKEIFLKRIINNPRFLCTIVTGQGHATDNQIVRNDEIRKQVEGIKNTEKLIEILSNNVRRMTPSECLRTMGFSNSDCEIIYKAASETQIYKQAGNSIVVTVLIALFAELYKDIDYEQIINDYVKKEVL